MSGRIRASPARFDPVLLPEPGYERAHDLVDLQLMR
jgi:hypothetical protein